MERIEEKSGRESFYRLQAKGFPVVLACDVGSRRLVFQDEALAGKYKGARIISILMFRAGEKHQGMGRAGKKGMTTRFDIDSVTAAVLALMQEFRLCDGVAENVFGCSAAQLAVLAAISRRGKLSVHALALELHLHQSSASAVVRKLAEDGLLEKRAAVADRRASELSLTRKGQTLARRVGPTGRPLLAAALSRLPDATMKDLVRCTRHLSEEMAEERAMLLQRK